MRRSSAALTALALTLVLAACGVVDVEVGGRGGGDATTTTTRPRPTTSTTEGDDPEADGPGSPPGPGGAEGACEEPPVWAFTVTTAQAPDDEPGAPGDDQCEPTPSPGPTPEPELGTGDVQVTLRWSSSADIDLHVFEPDGTEIWFSEPGPTASGGRLDVDSNVGCEQEASVENVFWPDGRMPLGGYRVVVTGYEVDGCGSGDYTLTAAVQGVNVLDASGTVATDEEDEFAFEAR